VLRVGRFFLLQVPVIPVIVLLAALAIARGLPRFAKVFRLGIFVPYAVPSGAWDVRVAVEPGEEDRLPG
jgi:multiple sugar transport system permease protein